MRCGGKLRLTPSGVMWSAVRGWKSRRRGSASLGQKPGIYVEGFPGHWQVGVPD